MRREITRDSFDAITIGNRYSLKGDWTVSDVMYDAEVVYKTKRLIGIKMTPKPGTISMQFGPSIPYVKSIAKHSIGINTHLYEEDR